MTPSCLQVERINEIAVVRFRDQTITVTTMITQVAKELNDLAVRPEYNKLILDFNQVNFLSSSAVGALVQFRKQAITAERQVVLCGLDEQLRKIFKVTTLDRLFTIVDTVQEAKDVSSEA
ncbi:MAG: hypothetical protein HJJLKODD_02115 [Phycisphaerae bacterium]|nr:hypothetical protein [Phycisphaerae bacterium]